MQQHQRWHFFRAGGFDQVRIDSGAQMLALDQLDQKLWAALSCPTRGIVFDRRTLDLIDSDGDGRIRAGEIIAAAGWAGSLLKDPDILLKHQDHLPLAAIDETTAEGSRLLAAARRILAGHGRPGADSISLDDVADAGKLLDSTNFNGDGIVPADAAGDPFLAGVMADIIVCLGGEPDRSGKPGVSRASLEKFFAEGQALAAWRRRGDSHQGTEALATLNAVAAKIDDYFLRCDLAAYDSDVAAALSRLPEDWAALAGQPLATPAPGRPLPLGQGLNPTWMEAMGRFTQLVVTPSIGSCQSLAATDWSQLLQRFAPIRAWLAEKPDTQLESLPADRLESILASDAMAGIDALIQRDLDFSGEAATIAGIDRLLRYTRDLKTLVDNFVAFRDFYTGSRKAVFQAGRLYLDGRCCELCVQVDDVDKHAVLATLSRIYLAYCECRRVGSGERMFIAAAVTGGDSDQLMVGRNGVFYDRDGNDWDATVVRIIDHPISIRQAFWSPYKKLIRMIGNQLEKMASAKAPLPASLPIVGPTAGPTGPAPHPAAATAPTPPPAAPAAAPFDAGRFAGIFAAAGLAVGAIGTAAATVVTGLLSLPWWQMPLAVAGLAVVVSGPSVAIASFKLHQRNLGPILDAQGWAVNARARINIPFGTALTELARLPEGAGRSLSDPYAEKTTPWRSYAVLAGVAALLAAALHFGWLTPLEETITQLLRGH